MDGVERPGLDERRRARPPESRVVVDHVELVRALVAGEGVADLRQRAPDQLARRLLVDVREFRLRQRVAGREQRHVVAGVDESVREQRDDQLDASVAGRRHGEPDRRQNGDAQLVTHSAHDPNDAILDAHVPTLVERADPAAAVLPPRRGARAGARSAAGGSCGRVAGRAGSAAAAPERRRPRPAGAPPSDMRSGTASPRAGGPRRPPAAGSRSGPPRSACGG